MRRPRSRTARNGLAVAVAGAAVSLIGVLGAPAANAYPPPGGATGEALVNASSAATGGVYWRWDQHNSDYQARPGYGFYAGDPLVLYCYRYGDPVGPYGNRLWYFAAEWYS